MRLLVSGLAVVVLATGSACAQNLSQLAKQQGCTGTPVVVEGTDLYKCQTQGAMSYFSGPPSAAGSNVNSKRNPNAPAGGPRSPTPANFPRVDSATQRDRDDVRKRVLSEELATEVKMMVESEVGLKFGAAPLPDESLTSPKYLDRMAKLRTTVDNHNKNIQALNKELERLR